MELFLTNVNAESLVKIFPGKSLGSVKIGDSSTRLKKMGFLLDNSKTSTDWYFKKRKYLVRLTDDKAVQIWFDDKSLNSLRFKGKKMPDVPSIESFRKIFHDC